MDWTFPLTGLDLSVVWDPELWLTFKQAVVWNTPETFWDKLWDRISYSECDCLVCVVVVALSGNRSGMLVVGWWVVGPGRGWVLRAGARTTCCPSLLTDNLHTTKHNPNTTKPTTGSKVPQAGLVGDMRISYAKFLQLLRGNRIKRLIIYGDLRTAIVEVRARVCCVCGSGLLLWCAHV